MQISGVSATNFGILIKEKIQIRDNVDISAKDYRRISRIAEKLNKGVAQGIAVFAEIAKPVETSGNISMRITTAPTQRHMACIHSFRPEAQIHQYKRRSRWVDLYNPEIVKNFSEFIRRQKGFIHHCTIDQNHRAEPFDKPAWRPNGMQTQIEPHKRITLEKLWG